MKKYINNLEKLISLSNSAKRKFVKDFNLPIDVFAEPMFSDALVLLNSQFNIENKLDQYITALNSFKSEEEFFAFSSNLIKEIVSDISKTDEYKDFTLMSMRAYDIDMSHISSEKLYQENNLGKTFVSFDLKNANFVSLVYSGALGIQSENYQFSDFMNKYTRLDYFKNSKNFRQTLFGQLSPRRQQTIQKFLVQGLFEVLDLSEESNIFSFTSDELVIEARLSEIELLNLKNTIFEDCIRVEEFELKPIKSTTGKMYYAKDFGDSFELKTVPRQYYTQAFKKFKLMDYNDSDLTFFKDGLLAKFIEPMFKK